MSEFLYPISVLSQDKTYLFREFTHLQYKNFTKTILDEDKNALERFINTLIDDLSEDCLDTTTLNVLDKFYIMLVIRARCISPEIIFQSEVEGENEEKTKVSIPVKINDMLQKIGEYELEYTFEFNDGAISVKGSLPKRLYYTDVYDVAAECIDTIMFGNKTIHITNLQTEEKKSILSQLPSAVLPEVVKFIQRQDEIVRSDPLLKFDTDLNLPFGVKFELHLYDGTIPEFIRVIYNANLKDFYKHEYTLMRRFKFDFEAVTSSTPAELNLYYSIISKDLEREKKEMQERDHQSGGGVAPPQNLSP